MAVINHYNPWFRFRDQFMELEEHIKAWLEENAKGHVYVGFNFDVEGIVLIRVQTLDWDSSGHTHIRVPLESILSHAL